jgi:hypothetical protein
MENPGIITPYLDEKYVNWRIRKHPFLKYREYQVVKDGVLQAYAFIVFKSGVSISDIASENQYATSLLLYQIIKDYSKKTHQFTIMLNPEYARRQNTINIINQFGFYPISTSKLVVRNLSGGNKAEIDELANWNITGIWTEGYSI